MAIGLNNGDKGCSGLSSFAEVSKLSHLVLLGFTLLFVGT